MNLGKSILTSVCVSLLVGLATWLLGAPVAESLMVAALVAVLGIGVSRFPLDGGVDWRLLAVDRDPSPRRELTRLAMEIAGVDGRSTDHATEYLSRLARDRLRSRGVPLADRTRAEALIGPFAYSVALEAPVPPLRHHGFERCVVDLERLDEPTKADDVT